MKMCQMTVGDVVRVKLRLFRGEKQHVIAAAYDCNQGRINEIAKGRRFYWIPLRSALLGDLRNAESTLGMVL